jgi:serine/threonine-protein kinase
MIEFRTLGGLELRGADGRELGAVLARPKRLALLAYLALSSPRGFQRRDALLALFWPELDDEHARASLRKAVHVLRQALGPGVLIGRGDDDLGLAPGTLWCDAVAFEAALAAGRPVDALELYRGELLPGFFVADAAPELGQWLDGERARLRAKAADAAWALARGEEGARNLTEAAQWARRAQGLAPDDERALRRLVTLLDRVGDRAGALDAYDAFARRLRAEYEVEPSPETQRLVTAVRARTAAGPPSMELAGRAGGVSPIASSTTSPVAASDTPSPTAAVAVPPVQTVREEAEATVPTRVPAPSTPALPGLTLAMARAFAGRYAIEREVARRGAMATVYVARDLRHDRQVAVKVLRPELAAGVGRQRFVREIAVAARLSHPHILTLHDSGEAGGLLYYVMPFIDGETLRDRLERERELPIDDALAIARQAAGALDHAHRHGVVHRDVKPENILLHAGEVLVADFGVAHAVRAAVTDSGAGDGTGGRLTATGFTVGTPGYMSPEQASGDRSVDGRADVYALGCVLYEMLTGEPPFTGPTPHAVLARHAADPVPSVRVVRPEVPVKVEAALFKALAKAPGDRFTTAQEFAAALQGTIRSGGGIPKGTSLAEGEPPTGPLPGEPDVRPASAVVRRAWRPPRFGGTRGRRLTMLVALLAAAGALAYAIIALRKPVAAAAAPRWILVADFEHPPGDRTLGLAVRELVSATLEESRAFATVPQDQVQRARQASLMPDTALLTGQRARHIAYRSAVRTVVDGRIDRIGEGRYSIVMRAVDVEDGRSVASATEEGTEATMIATVRRLANRIGSQLGPRRDSTPVRAPGSEGITPSFEAYRRWVEATEWHMRGDYSRAARMSREAVRLDPEFAAAWLRLAVQYSNLGFEDSARLAFLEARRFADRLTPSDRYRVEANLIAIDSGDKTAVVETYNRLIEADPTNAWAYASRGSELRHLGRYDEAVDSFRRAVSVGPFEPAPLYLSGLVLTLAPLGRIDEARAVNERLHGSLKRAHALIIAVSAADWAEAETLATTLLADPTLSTQRRQFAAMTIASVRASRGQVSAAEQSLHDAAVLTTASRAGCCDNAPKMAQLLLRVASGRRSGDRRLWAPGDTTPLGLLARGLRSALDGDTASARRELRALHARRIAESDPIRRDGSLLEAGIAAHGAEWREVIRLVGSSAWRGEPGRGGGLNLRRWLAADAYERLGRSDSAAAYFELLTRATRSTYWEIYSNGLASSFAHRRLALLYTQLGRLADARRHWEVFLGAFTSPDPEFRPMVDDARQQLARLSASLSATCTECAAGVAVASSLDAPTLPGASREQLMERVQAH